MAGSEEVQEGSEEVQEGLEEVQERIGWEKLEEKDKFLKRLMKKVGTRSRRSEV